MRAGKFIIPGLVLMSMAAACHRTGEQVRWHGLALTVLRTPAERGQGLQGRILQKGEGALFVYEKEAAHTFFMGGCLQSLDIYFLSTNGRILRAFLNCPPGAQNQYSGPAALVVETSPGAKHWKEGDELGTPKP